MMRLGRFAPFESVEQMDAELARLARSDGALRLGMGMGLEALAQKGGHHEMGFSSLEAYALERCERSARWVQQSRKVARQLGELPAIRKALLAGELSWSMASLLANEATGDDEVLWLAEARGRTLREMRHRMAALRRLRAGGQPETGEQDETADILGADEEFTVLTVTVDREDAWLFECVRMIVRRVSEGRTEDDVLEALLAEGFSTLSRWLPKDAISEPEEDPTNAAQRAWEAAAADSSSGRPSLAVINLALRPPRRSSAPCTRASAPWSG